MIRSQVYLTQAERQKLHFLARETGKSQSELIRAAIDQFILQQQEIKLNKLAAIVSVKGLWAERDDLPDFKKLRKELDRY